MASANSWTLEIASPVAAPRLFRAAVMDWHTLAPKLAPDVVASAHPVEGEGGVGSVRQFNFTSGKVPARRSTSSKPNVLSPIKHLYYIN
ncbi:unnamed protein product [Urochloa humidicola]